MSWEQRRREWKENPPDVDKVDKWFESLSPDERFDAFFQSASFRDISDKFQRYLHSIFDSEKSNQFSFEPTPRLISYCLGKMVMRTPEFRSVVKKNHNIARVLVEQESRIMRRIYAICTYEPQKKPGVPEFAYNLDIPWKWEDTAVEILGY